MDADEIKRIEFLNARRKRFRNLRFIIPVACGYILYDGFRTINKEASAPPYFLIFMAVFAVLMVVAFIVNEKRLKSVEAELNRLETESALETDAQSVSDEDQP